MHLDPLVRVCVQCVADEKAMRAEYVGENIIEAFCWNTSDLHA